MKKLLATIALAAAASAPALADNFGVTVGMGDNGYYGRIDIGNTPAPVVYNPQPLIIEQQRVYVEPVYVRVPEGHRKHWSHHCGAYNACGRPVYFVQDNWYHNTYRPQYARDHGRYWNREHDRYERREGRREERREERREDRRDDRRHG
jgi:hypothetical protein